MTTDNLVVKLGGVLLCHSLPIGEEVVDHGGVREGGGVAEVRRVVFGDLAEDAAHDFAGPGFGQSRCPVDRVWRGDGADFRADLSDEFGLEVVGIGFARVEGDISVNALALDFVREATTAASATLPWETNALSTSAVPMRWPEMLITSSTRPVIQ